MAYVACSKVFTRFGTDKREALRGASTKIIAEPSEKNDGQVSSDTLFHCPTRGLREPGSDRMSSGRPAV